MSAPKKSLLPTILAVPHDARHIAFDDDTTIYQTKIDLWNAHPEATDLSAVMETFSTFERNTARSYCRHITRLKVGVWDEAQQRISLNHDRREISEIMDIPAKNISALAAQSQAVHHVLSGSLPQRLNELLQDGPFRVRHLLGSKSGSLGELHRPAFEWMDRIQGVMGLPIQKMSTGVAVELEAIANHFPHEWLASHPDSDGDPARHQVASTYLDMLVGYLNGRNASFKSRTMDDGLLGFEVWIAGRINDAVLDVPRLDGGVPDYLRIDPADVATSLEFLEQQEVQADRQQKYRFAA